MSKEWVVSNETVLWRRIEENIELEPMVWLYNPKNLKIFRIWLESDTEAVLESGDTEINQILVIGKLSGH